VICQSRGARSSTLWPMNPDAPVKRTFMSRAAGLEP
jgi:hypothetical protein